jgi:hypothetical protein
MRRWQLAATLLGFVSLAGCGGVQITPDPEIPKALVEALPAKVGLVVTAEQRNYAHSETRSGVSWSVALGAGQQELARSILGATFREVNEFADLDAARAAPGLLAIFEPRIEQYSFATAQETGGEYVAVTIRYRINVHAPNGERYDSLTLTGYGTALADSLSTSEPMADATESAMRDAASRFLTQFPSTEAGKVLAGGKRLEVSAEDAMRALAASGLRIEAVPIRVSRRVNPDWKPASAAAPTIVPQASAPVSPPPVAPAGS